MIMFGVLTLGLLAMPVSCVEYFYYAQDHPTVTARLREFTRGLQMRINANDMPYQDNNGIEEQTCWQYKLKCGSVYFYQRSRMFEVHNYTFSARTYLDADLDTPYDLENLEDERFPAKVTTSKSTAVTDSTTEGWRISLKLGGETGEGPGKGLIEVGGEYGQEYTKSQTVTTQTTFEAPCPADHRCTIQTLTYHAHVRGRCRIEPIINCGGEADACAGFRKISGADYMDAGSYEGVPAMQASPEVYEWKTALCDQWTDHSERQCQQGHYKEEDCDVYAPLIDSSGKPRTSVVVTRESLTPKERPPPGDFVRPDVSFLHD